MIFRHRRATILKGIIVLTIMGTFALTACGPGRYRSAHHKDGMESLARRQPAAAVSSFSAAVAEAGAKGDKEETAQMLSILGWALAETGDFGGARTRLEEAIALAEANGVDPSVMYGRLAVVDAKSQDAETGIAAAEKSLDLTAARWRERAGGGTREAVIDYAAAHAGLPPDEEMIRSVIMSETALAVLYHTQGDMASARTWAARALAHGESLGFIMNMAPAEDQQAFFQGTGVAAGVARAAAESSGDHTAAEAFLETGRKAFARIGVTVTGDDLLGAYMASGGYAAQPGKTTGGERFSEAYEAAMALWNDGRLSAAQEAFTAVADTAENSGRRAEQIRALSQAGWIQAEQGRYADALKSLARSIAVDPRSDETAMSHTRTAAIQARLGNIEKALAEADQAMTVVTDARPRLFQDQDREAAIDRFVKNPGLPPDVLLLKAILGSEAARTVTYYFMGDYPRTAAAGARALAHFTAAQTAVGIAGRREQRDFHDGMGYTAMATGDAMAFLGKAEQGRSMLKSAQDAFKLSGSRFGMFAAQALHACTYLREKRYRDGAKELAAIWSQLEKDGYDDIMWRSRSRFAYYFDIHSRELNAQLLPTLGTPSPAALTANQLRWRQETTRVVRESLTAVSPLLPPGQLDNAGSSATLFEKAATGSDLMRTGTSLFKDIQLVALSNYEAAIDHVESIRSMLETDLNKRAFRADKSILYDGYIRLSTELHGAAAGFEALERAKARNLLDLLATRTVAFKPSAQTQELADIRQAVTAATDTVPPSGEGSGSGGDTLAAQTRRYRALVVSARDRSPELASFLTVTYPRVDDVRRMLPQGSALVAYHLSDRDGIVFTVTPEAVMAETLKMGKNGLTPAVAGLRQAIVDMDPDTVSSAAGALYEVLIAPVAGHLKANRLIISPDGVLFYLPFGVLQKDGQYLTSRYSLTFTPSAGVLGYALKKNGGRSGPMLALGNPDLGDTALDLPHAGQEARTAAAQFAGSRAYVRSEATESLFRDQAKNYRILHLATHGEYSSSDPLYSGLRLAKDAKNDGHLQAAEIFSIDLDAALVVLSACQTGLGQVTEGGEIIGLTRAFLYAGTPSVVASLWSVDDASTAILMERFYQNLKTMPRDAALRAAQVDLMHTEDTSAPYHWAAFYLTGAW
ncbi:MAG: CHAT domain-containing protein [Pseudomonadota bacterium]